MNLRSVPYLRLFVPFALGLVLGGWLDAPVPGLGYGLAVAAFAGILLAEQKIHYRYRWTFGVFCALGLFGLGYFHIVRYNEIRQPEHFSSKIQDARFFIGTVYDTPGKGGKLKVPFRVEAVGKSPDSLEVARGNLLLFLDMTPRTETLRYGDRLIIHATVRPTEPAKNPHAFDYGRYLHFQNIHFQTFVKPDSLILLSSGHGNAVWRAAFACREKLLELLREHFPTQDEYAVASALLVGYKEDLSDDLRAAYAETGSMHALAVSGTHVGMLYVGVYFLVQRLKLRGHWGKRMNTVTILAVIWGFAFLTGATASVLRATVMFSTFLIGRTIYRKSSIWNVMGASAFILLLYNPYFLFDAGFQLSYAAVAGMVFFYPQFRQMSPGLPKWAAGAWDVLLVGVTAQLGTLPLSLYYFHQFPVYFWLAGWAVVFGGAIFMAGGAALVALELLFPAAANWLGMLLYWMLKGLNQLIFFIQGLPGSVLSGIWIAGWAAALLYVFIALLGATMVWRKARLLLAALGVLALLGVCRAVQQFGQMEQQQIVVYYISQSRLIDFFDGQKVVSLSDSLISAKQVLFAAQSNRWAAGMRKISELPFEAAFEGSNLLCEPPFIQFFDQKMVLLDDAKWMQKGSAPSVPVDVLLLSNSPNVKIAECRERFPFRLVVFDSSNRLSLIERWKSECELAGIPCHNVRQSGAWVWKKAN